MSPFRDNPLLRVAVGFAVGIGVADVLQRYDVPVPLSTYPLLAGGCLLLTVLGEGVLRVCLRRRPTLRGGSLVLFRFPLYASILLLIAIASMGAWRYEVVSHRVVTPWPTEHVNCRAVVRSHAEPRARSVRYLLDVEGRRVYGYLYGADSPLTCGWGDTLVLRDVAIEPPRQFSDSLSFDYARYLYSRRVSGTVLVSSQHATCHPYGGTPPLHIRLRQQAVGRLQALFARTGLPDDVRGMVEALMLGNRNGVDDDVRDAYADAGASHLLALSGLHVGVLYMLLTMTIGLLLRSRVGRRLCGLLAAGLLWLFALLAGFPPSLVRAVTMFTVYAVVALVSADRSPLSALSLTALAMLGVQPFLLFDVGFQLSFASMLSILLLMPQWEVLRRRMPLLARSSLLSAPVAVAFVSVAAQVGVAPLVLHHFGRFPTYFLITNIVVQPFFYAVMTLMVVWIALSWTPLAPLLARPLVYAVRGMNALLATIARWPGSTLQVAHFTLADALLLWLALYFLLSYLIKKHTPSAVWALAFVALLLLSRLLS